MLRLFNQHYIRKEYDLCGIWNTKINGSDYSIPVPGCWEQNPELLRYRGKAVYTKKIYLPHETSVRLVFKGVSHTADVFFDGKFAVHHYNAYTPFDAVIKNVSKGYHEIKLEIDNTFSQNSALHIPNDYYTYGGITRPAAIQEIGDAYIKDIKVTTEMSDGGFDSSFTAEIINISQNDISAHIIAETAGQKLDFGNVTLKPGKNTFTLKKFFSSVTAWSCENPVLYDLVCTLYADGRPIDDYIDRIGFRTVKISGNKILLNNKEIFLKGFNRHEDYATVGCAIPLQLMVKDIDLIKGANANAIRTCHYPNDERFLDLCDENGILVWEENHARGLYLPDMKNPNFDRQCEDCINEMIDSHFNHPSIIIWGLLNECASETKTGRKKYERQYNQVRSLDLSRPVTSATCRHFTDICLDLPDILSFNLYPGWYEDKPIKQTIEEEIAWGKNKGGDKPVIVSEFGGAALYGFRDSARVKWSEEYQADLIKESITTYMSNPDIRGIFIWQFCDCNVTSEGDWFFSRAKCQNNKGIVDTYRREKLSYAIVKELYKD